MNKIHIFIVVFYAFCVARVLPTTSRGLQKLGIWLARTFSKSLTTKVQNKV